MYVRSLVMHGKNGDQNVYARLKKTGIIFETKWKVKVNSHVRQRKHEIQRYKCE